MVTVNYKILFEVQLHHEFYLTNSDGSSVFDLALQADRQQQLRNRFASRQATVDDDVLFTVPAFAEPLFRQYRLHLLPSYSGFQVLVEVKAQALGDGTVVYRPVVPLPPDLPVTIAVVKKNAAMDSFSNQRFLRPLPAAYLLSNDSMPAARTFPYLCNPVAAFDAGRVYEQGELASFGPGDLRQFYFDGAADQWKKITGSCFVSEADAMVLPRRFSYRLDIADAVTSAEVQLIDAGGQVVRTAAFSSTTALGSLPLDFSNDDLLPKRPDVQSFLTGATTSGLYSLSITLNHTSTRVHKIVFAPDAAEWADCWAWVTIKPVSANTAFNLLAADGFLVTRKPVAGGRVPAPVFEIPVKSRFTFWRYGNDKAAQLKTSTETADFCDVAGPYLVSKTPRPATYLPTLFRKADNTLHYLPNPVSYTAISSAGKRLYTDILVPSSKMFPIV
jgi:hypothetical protein